MNIALCVSGHLRSYLSTKKVFDELVSFLRESHHVDIFVATMNVEEAVSSWSEAHGLSNICQKEIKVDGKKIVEYYHPKRFMILDDAFLSSIYSPFKLSLMSSSEFNGDQRAIYNNIIHITKMFYMITQSNSLKQQSEYEQGYKYDVVIRYRPEFLPRMEIWKQPELWNYLSLHKDEKFVVGYMMKDDKGRWTIRDTCNIGSSSGMDIYSSTIWQLPQLYDNQLFFGGELSLVHTLQKFNVMVVPSQPLGTLFSEVSNLQRL